MHILVAIPIIVNPIVAKEAIDQVINKSNVTVLLCNNGGDHAIDELLLKYSDMKNVVLWKKEKNVYVNPIWNEFIRHFLESDEYDRLIIMNSDLTLQKDWDKVVINRWNVNYNEIIVPHLTDDKRAMYLSMDPTYGSSYKTYSNTPGIFITLNKEQAREVYPIPEECKIWFGDTWIFAILVEGGQGIVTPANLIAYHHHSTSVQKVPGIHEIIELDKIQWAQFIHSELSDKITKSKINKLKNGFSSSTLPSE